MRGIQTIARKARAKINLTLHVGREVGHALHPLESLVTFADIADTVSVRTAQGFSLTIDGPFGADLDPGDDNLILKAASLANETLGLDGAAFHLTKTLPVASGIGGGSADAAAAIRAMEAMAGRSAELSAKDLMRIGADVPVCYLSQACLMAGAGETLSPMANCDTLNAVLVNPGIGVSTGEIFRRFDIANPALRSPRPHAIDSNFFEQVKAGTNELQPYAVALAPVIRDVLDTLGRQNGVRLSRMSGSGATCFAIFGDRKQANAAQNAIQKSNPQWWVRAAEFGDFTQGQVL